MNDTGQAIEPQFEALLRGETPSSVATAVDNLLRGRQLIFDAQRKSDFHDRIVPRLLDLSANANPQMRWTAIAAMERMSSSLGARHNGSLRIALTTALAKPHPPIAGLRDVEERVFAVRALEAADSTWAPAFLAAIALTDESTLKVVPLATKILASRFGGVNGTLRYLTTCAHGKEVDPLHAGAPLHALAEVMPAARGATEETGELLDGFLRHVIVAAPKSRDALANHVLVFLDRLVQSRLVLTLEPSSYVALRRLRSWFSPLEWPRFLKEGAHVALRAAMVDAITLLARQGLYDETLCGLLRVLHPSETEAETTLAEIASSPRIAPAIAGQLRGIAVVRQRLVSEHARDAANASMDVELGDLMRIANRTSQRSERASSDILATLELVAPETRPHLKALTGSVRAVCGRILEICRARAIELQGDIGNVVEFSPLEHEFLVDQGTTPRWVRIVEPAAIKRDSRGTVDVLVKAIVEPVLQPAPMGDP